MVEAHQFGIGCELLFGKRKVACVVVDELAVEQS
jgi:hypothetical protein